MDYQINFERIVEIRLFKKRWKSRRLAREAGISHTYLWEIEHGLAKNVGPEILGKIADALNVNMEELLIYTRMVQKRANPGVKSCQSQIKGKKKEK